jgi:glycosyltransferase involved in cell wall biosynthesis
LLHSVIIIIPAYNEGTGIGDIVRRIKAIDPAYDVLVVNDGSGDDTAERASGAGAVVASHPFNLGYGVAIQTGYKYALAKGYNFAMQMDGDGQHDPAFIPQVLEPVMTGKTDFTLGSRFLEKESYAPSLPRRIGMIFFRKLISALINTRITDTTSGYQAFNHKVIRLFTTEVFPCDFPDADMLLTLHRAGFRIMEVPVRMRASASGKSMHAGWMPLYYIFKMLLSIFVTLLRKGEVKERTE